MPDRTVDEPQPRPVVPHLESVENGVFHWAALAPATLLLREGWEDVVWDEVLAAAHAAGHLPVGPVFVTYEGYMRGMNGKSESGRSFPPEYGPMVMMVDNDIVVVRGEVEVGLSL